MRVCQCSSPKRRWLWPIRGGGSARRRYPGRRFDAAAAIDRLHRLEQRRAVYQGAVYGVGRSEVPATGPLEVRGARSARPDGSGSPSAAGRRVPPGPPRPRRAARRAAPEAADCFGRRQPAPRSMSAPEPGPRRAPEPRPHTGSVRQSAERPTSVLADHVSAFASAAASTPSQHEPGLGGKTRKQRRGRVGQGRGATGHSAASGCPAAGVCSGADLGPADAGLIRSRIA